MAEIVRGCSTRDSLRLVIYNLAKDIVECATVPPHAVENFKLGKALDDVKKDAVNGPHAILAYDITANTVYLIDSVPELQIAAAVLLCVSMDLLNGQVNARAEKCGIPEVIEEYDCEDDDDDDTEDPIEYDWDEPWESSTWESSISNDEPWKNPPIMDTADNVTSYRFKLGRH